MANKRKDTATPALWEKETKLIFCDLCIHEIEQGNRPTSFFNKEGWQNITKKFKEMTGREYDRMQFKNKWDQLKKDWKFWKELKRGCTGLGWDHVKRTIDAPDEWWAERLLVVQNAKKFKQSGIEPEMEEKFDRMFGGVVATGNYACSPNEVGFGGNNTNVGTPRGTGDSTDVPSPELHGYESTSRPKRNRGDKRRKSGGTSLRDNINQLVSTYNAESECSSTTTIEQALEILNDSVDIFDDEALYLFGAELIEDPVRRSIFVKIPASRRVPYLRSFYARLNI